MCMVNLLRCVKDALPDWGLRKYVISKFRDLGKLQQGSNGLAKKELRDGNFHKFPGLPQNRSAIGVNRLPRDVEGLRILEEEGVWYAQGEDFDPPLAAMVTVSHDGAWGPHHKSPWGHVDTRLISVSPVANSSRFSGDHLLDMPDQPHGNTDAEQSPTAQPPSADPQPACTTAVWVAGTATPLRPMPHTISISRIHPWRQVLCWDQNSSARRTSTTALAVSGSASPAQAHPPIVSAEALRDSQRRGPVQVPEEVHDQ